MLGVPSCRSNLDHRTSFSTALLPLVMPVAVMGPQGWHGSRAPVELVEPDPLLADCDQNLTKVSLSFKPLVDEDEELEGACEWLLLFLFLMLPFRNFC